jgi:hypothetical protein
MLMLRPRALPIRPDPIICGGRRSYRSRTGGRSAEATA